MYRFQQIDDLYIQWKKSILILHSYLINSSRIKFIKGSNYNIKLAEAQTIEIQNIFTELVSNYSHPDRKYHNIQHIFHILSIIEELKDYAHNMELIKVAAWFHDAVYNSQANDNEEKSATYAAEALKLLGISDPSVISQVQNLILSTKTHSLITPHQQNTDIQILLDADLGILGSPPNKYQKYTQSIRQEYKWVKDSDYCGARKEVLENFLRRPCIYLTPIMYQKYEQTARKNIRAEIEYWSNLE